MWPIETIILLKGDQNNNFFFDRNFSYIEALFVCSFRIGWMALILLFTYFTCTICVEQVLRFWNGPIVVSMEKDYRNWAYEPVAITICTDYLNETTMHEIVQRYANTDEDCDPESYELYRQYFALIASLNLENFHLINEFGHTDLFANFTGEDLLSIAIEVNQLDFDASKKHLKNM